MNIKIINPQDKNKDYVEQILKNRDIEDRDAFFRHTWRDVQSPYDIDNIEQAAKLMIQYLKGTEKVAILVDSDMDGYSSSALIYNYFKMQEKHGNFGKLAQIEFIFHDGKKHGLSDSEVMKALRDTIKPALLIIPDASGSDKQYTALNDLGIKIIVLDHHQVSDTGDGVRTIVVNNQQSKKYKNKDLSGVGVVFQLCKILDDMLDFVIADSYLDLVALGLAADVMDFRSNETRFLIQEGLANINLPFLKAFKKDYCYQLTRQYDEDQVKFNYTTVSWNIAPLINAITRIGTLAERELIFKAFLVDSAEELVPSGKRGESDKMIPLVKEALRVATNAKSRQTRRQEKLIESIDKVIREDNMLDDKVLIITIDDFTSEQRSLSGLIANKFIDWYKRPCILLFKSMEEENGELLLGSLRSPDNIEAYQNFKNQCEESNLVTFVAGHQSAAGIGVDIKNVDALRQYFNNKYEDIDTKPTIWVDFIFDSEDDLLELAETIDVMSDYWGNGIKQPIIAIKNVPINRGTAVLYKADTNPTLSIKLPNGGSCIRFRSSKEELASLMLPSDVAPQQYRITIAGALEINEFRGERSPQLKIQDYQIDRAEYIF